MFSADRAAQARAVQVACAFGQLVALAPLWPGGAPPGPRAARLGEELRQEVEKLGSYLQVFLQVSPRADGGEGGVCDLPRGQGRAELGTSPCGWTRA